MAIMEDPDHADVETVGELVAADRQATKALLRIVNSAYYSLRHPIDDVTRAVVLLGPLTVTGTLMAIELYTLRRDFDDTTRPTFDQLIRHSAATAFVARHLMKEILHRDGVDESVSYAHVGEAFACGMLHDFGKMILLFNHPEAAADIYRVDVENASIRDISVSEEVAFGCDHVDVGADFASGLHYPPLVSKVIRCHLYPEEHEYDAYADAVLIRATCAADVVASALGLGFPHQLDRPGCINNDVWRQLAEYDLAGSTPAALADSALGLEAHIRDFVSAVSGAA